jgi:hypothetical protein
LPEGPLFLRVPKHEPGRGPEVADRVRDYVRRLTNDPDAQVEALQTGQGVNFRVRTLQGHYRLKIIVNRGYPSLELLEYLDVELSRHSIPFPRLVHAETVPDLAPHGLVLQEWVEGQDLQTDGTLESWLVPLVSAVAVVHRVSLSHFGSLGGGLRFADARARIERLVDSVEDSFRGVLQGPCALVELERAGVWREEWLAQVVRRAVDLFEQIEAPPAPVLLHGDALPGNVIVHRRRHFLIDWDEAQAGWWPYEAARLAYYVERPHLLERFWHHYPHDQLQLPDFLKIVTLEQVRQRLRQLFQLGFLATTPDVRARKAEPHVARIEALLGNPLGALV